MARPRSNLASPTKEQVTVHLRVDKPMWESLSVEARKQSGELMLVVTAADLVRKFVKEGLDRIANNGKGRGAK